MIYVRHSRTEWKKKLRVTQSTTFLQAVFGYWKNVCSIYLHSRRVINSTLTALKLLSLAVSEPFFKFIFRIILYANIKVRKYPLFRAHMALLRQLSRDSNYYIGNSGLLCVTGGSRSAKAYILLRQLIHFSRDCKVHSTFQNGKVYIVNVSIGRRYLVHY